MNMPAPIAEPSSAVHLQPGYVLTIALLAFLLPLVSIEYDVLRYTGGTFSYPLDDSFIHLAVAKTLAFHHVWGISKYAFASASSSILYPILIAVLFFIFGAHTIVGFIINVLAGITLLIAIQRWLIRQGITPMAQLLILLAVIFLTPLPVIVVCGMEHTLQFLFCFLFITRFSVELADRPADFSRTLYIYGVLVAATRYEGAALIIIACLLAMWKRRFIPALQLGIYSLLPIFIFGFISLGKGSYFLPNSVLLKSGAPPMTFDGLYHFFTQEVYDKLTFSITGYNIVAAQRLLLLLPVTWLLFIRPLKATPAYRYALLLLMSAVLVHVFFAGYVNFPRYEAWLIGCSVAVSGMLMAKYGSSLLKRDNIVTKWIAGLTAALIFLPLIIRSVNALGDISQACINIYEQQYQMGEMLHRYYNKTPVAIGDIGAVSYFTEGKDLDLVGLANIDVARSKKNNYYTPQFMNKLTKDEGVRIAICYDYYTMAGLRQYWTKVATWTIPDNVTCGDATVAIYAVDSSDAPDLKKNLVEFQPHLPQDVEVHYYYDVPDTAGKRTVMR